MISRILCRLIGLALAGCSAGAAAFPTKPVTIVVPAPPGGTADSVVRTLLPTLAAALGRPVLVDNRAGASGVIASQAVAAAAPDGHTLLMNYTSHAINPWLVAKLPYDSAKAFVPVAFLGKVPLLLAVPVDGHRTAAELIADARAHPGKLSYGSSATGGASHLGGELFSQLTSGRLLMVPYKGGAAAATDLAAGRISMLLDSQLALQGVQQGGACASWAWPVKSLLPSSPTWSRSVAHCRALMRRRGSASWPRPARRRRWSSGSMRRLAARWATRRCPSSCCRAASSLKPWRQRPGTRSSRRRPRAGAR